MTEVSFPDYLDVDYEDGADESSANYPSLTDKIAKATTVVRTAIEQYRSPAVLWSGGKDSTLVLYIAREVAAQNGFAVPPVVYIDRDGQPSTDREFVEQWTDRWDLDLIVVNEDGHIDPESDNPDIDSSTLNGTESDNLEPEEAKSDDSKLQESESDEHELGRVVISEYGFDCIMTGHRWDEQDVQSDETFFSPRHESATTRSHDRIQPILQFDERAIWDAIWGFVVPDTISEFPAGYVPQNDADLPSDIGSEDIPVSPRYFDGYRSIGTVTDPTDHTNDDAPAWLQVFDDVPENESQV